MTISLPPITKGLTIFMVILHVICLTLFYKYEIYTTGILGFYSTLSENFNVFTSLSAIFIHNLFNPLHIIVNLSLFLLFGSYVENRLGSKTFVIVILLGGLSSIISSEYYSYKSYNESTIKLTEYGINVNDVNPMDLSYDEYEAYDEYLIHLSPKQGFSGSTSAIMILYLFFTILNIKKLIPNLISLSLIIICISTVFFDWSDGVKSGEYGHLGGFIFGVVFYLLNKKGRL